MKIAPSTVLDFYKTGHIEQYPKGLNMIYNNFTARGNKHENIPEYC